METEKKLAMLAKLDEIYEAALKKDDRVKVQEAIKPYLDEVAAEYGIDSVDLFVEYMDHVAISSKKLNLNNGEEKSFEIDMSDLENINGMKF